MPYNIWCDGCKNHIGMGKFEENHDPFNQVQSQFHTLSFQFHDTDVLLLQGSATMLRRRKWGTTTPRQSTGKH